MSRVRLDSCVLLALIGLMLSFLSCSKQPLNLDIEAPWIAHLEYRSGGEAPLGFVVTVFEDGRLRFFSPRHKVRWSQLSETEKGALAGALQAPSLSAELQELRRKGPRFGCCDLEEIGIWLTPAEQANAVALTSGPRPAGVLALVELIVEIGTRHFGRHFRFSKKQLQRWFDEGPTDEAAEEIKRATDGGPEPD